MAEVEIQWKQITSHVNYRVSNTGLVKNFKSGRILKQHVNNSGYKYVVLSKGGILQNKSVHRLVACGFLPRDPSKPTVDHIDRQKTNNNLTNLRWLSASNNSKNKEVNGGIYKDTKKYQKKNGDISICISYISTYISLNDDFVTTKHRKNFKTEEEAKLYLEELKALYPR